MEKGRAAASGPDDDDRFDDFHSPPIRHSVEALPAWWRAIRRRPE
jgi:hypothetical protein